VFGPLVVRTAQPAAMIARLAEAAGLVRPRRAAPLGGELHHLAADPARQ